MATKNVVTTVRPAIGGLDLTADPTILDPNYLVTANNIYYKEGGQRKRRPGFIAYQPSSSSAGSSTNAMVSSSSNVRALIDTWDYSSASAGSHTPVQRLVAVTGASIFRSTGDGLWTAVSATSSFGSNSNLQTNIVRAANYAVISDGVTAPIAYNLRATTLVGPTTGTWPVFESAVYHQNRLWMVGISTSSFGTPSSIVVSGADNIFDSTGTDSVTLSVDDGDGDRIVGMSQSYFGDLFAFKGPQFGSVHQISGNTSTNYTKNKITRGAPALSHHSIITTPTDIYWLSKYGVHSLQTTIKFGDVEQAYLSLPIQTLWRENLITLSDLQNAKGFWNPTKNLIGWFITPTGASGAGSRYWILAYNYALSDPTPGGRKFWSIWQMSRATGANWGNTAAAMVLNPSGTYAGSVASAHAGEPHLYLGADNGLVYQGDYAFFDDDGTPYPVNIKTPVITRFKTAAGGIPETSEKQFTGIVTYYVVNNSEITSGMTYTVTIDNRVVATGSITGGAQGGVLGSGVLGVMILGGLTFNYEESIIEGRGRGIQIEWFQTHVDQDFEHLGYSIRFAPTETQPLEAI